MYKGTRVIIREFELNKFEVDLPSKKTETQVTGKVNHHFISYNGKKQFKSHRGMPKRKICQANNHSPKTPAISEK